MRRFRQLSVEEHSYGGGKKREVVTVRETYYSNTTKPFNNRGYGHRKLASSAAIDATISALLSQTSSHAKIKGYPPVKSQKRNQRTLRGYVPTESRWAQTPQGYPSAGNQRRQISFSENMRGSFKKVKAEESDEEDSDAEGSINSGDSPAADDTDVEDSDAEDTNVEDSDAEDTNVEDPDAEDTNIEDSNSEYTNTDDSDAEDSNARPTRPHHFSENHHAIMNRFSIRRNSRGW